MPDFKDDNLQVLPVPLAEAQLDAAGVPDTAAKLEPEEAPVRRTLETTAPATNKDGSPVIGADGRQVIIPAYVTTDMQAGEVARNLSTLCQYCKFMDRTAWHRVKAKLETQKEGFRQLNQLRSVFLELGAGELPAHEVIANGDFDVEHALSVLGVCQVQTEIFRDLVVVHPQAGCPAEGACGPGGEPLHDLFKPRVDGEGRAQRTAIYDSILKTAAGEKS
jgi:hypothetical protein